jgi:hypothetical protein
LHITAVAMLFTTLIALVATSGDSSAEDGENRKISNKKRRSASITAIEEKRKNKD